ncbi:MAG: hypothetical protein IJZ34_15720 [Lachnospiraceae bacterium]|nr:hypothetical protein [Lachnospiraceae bacterium]
MIYTTILLQQLIVYEERSEESKAVVMKPQMVDIVRTDAKEWIYLWSESCRIMGEMEGRHLVILFI